MRVLCLTEFDSFYPEGGLRHRIEEEFTRQSHEYIRAAAHEFSMQFDTTGQLQIGHPVHDIDSFDLIDHALRSDDDWGWELVFGLKTFGKPVLRSERVPHADKVTMAFLFNRAGVRFPRSGIAHTLEQADALALDLGYPVIGKARTGSQGRTVRLLQNRTELAEFVSFALEIAPNFLLQKAVHPLGVDVRAFVLDGRVIGCMERFAADGDFRANYSISGRGGITQLNAEEERAVLAAAAVYQMDYAGVDMIRSHEGPVIIEINKVPGLKGFESTIGINIAAQIVSYYEERVAGYKKAGVSRL